MRPSEDAFFDLPAEEQCWAQWFLGCTIAKCEPAARSLLARKATASFRKWLATYSAETSCADVLEGERAWLEFEKHMLAQGKHYKNWLRSAVERDAPCDATSRIKIINSIVNKRLFRTVVRQYVIEQEGQIRRNSKGEKKGVITEPPPDGWDWAGFEGSVPASSETVAGRDDLQLIRTCLPDLIPLMTSPTRVAMAAKLAGVSLADITLERFAGVKRSQINASLRQLAEKLGTYLNERFPGEADIDLQLAAIQLLMADTEQWLNLPVNAALLRFLQSEGKHHETF